MVCMKDIRAVARRIGEQFHAHKVILFGSYAYGTPTEDSDVDLLVVMPVKRQPWKVEVNIRRSIPIPFPADILVRDPEVIKRRIAWNDFFLMDVMEKGNVVYEPRRRRVGEKGGGRLPRHAGVSPLAKVHG